MQAESEQAAIARRRRWSLPVEVVWWVESAGVCALVVSPGIAVGLMLAPVFLPILISHVRHNRSLGSVGYWFSVGVVNLQVLGVLAIPLGDSMKSGRDWAVWGCGAVVACIVGAASMVRHDFRRRVMACREYRPDEGSVNPQESSSDPRTLSVCRRRVDVPWLLMAASRLGLDGVVRREKSQLIDNAEAQVTVLVKVQFRVPTTAFELGELPKQLVAT
jgi:hypothetical protein